MQVVIDTEAAMADFEREAALLVSRVRQERNIQIPTDAEFEKAWMARGKRIEKARKLMADAMKALAED